MILRPFYNYERKEGRKEMFYLIMHSKHFIYSYRLYSLGPYVAATSPVGLECLFYAMCKNQLLIV